MENTRGRRRDGNRIRGLVDAAWQLIQNHTSDTMVNYGVTYPTLDATMEPREPRRYTRTRTRCIKI